MPFLGRGKQAPALADFIGREYPDAKADLATSMLARMVKLADRFGSLAAVTPQNWLFLGSYKKLRRDLLERTTFNCIGALGPRAFETIGGEVVNAALVILSEVRPMDVSSFTGLDANNGANPADKAVVLRGNDVTVLPQNEQQGNPDARIAVMRQKTGKLLGELTISPNGIHGADSPRFRQMFWEHVLPSIRWRLFQLTVEKTTSYGGREYVFYWPDDGKIHKANPLARIQGSAAWGKNGIAISMMSDLAVTLYTGEIFDISCSPIVPHDQEMLTAIWAFCSSPEYCTAVRAVDQALKVTNGTLVKIPFDLEHWQAIAAEKYPNGLPEPYSDDPTQWLFHGHPASARFGNSAACSPCTFGWLPLASRE